MFPIKPTPLSLSKIDKIKPNSLSTQGFNFRGGEIDLSDI